MAFFDHSVKTVAVRIKKIRGKCSSCKRMIAFLPSINSRKHMGFYDLLDLIHICESQSPEIDASGGILDIFNDGLTETQLYILGGLSTIGLGYAGYRFFSRRIKYPETAASNIRVTLNDGHRMPLLG